nr:hypothetical protein [Schlesneria paludicola]
MDLTPFLHTDEFYSIQNGGDLKFSLSISILIWGVQMVLLVVFNREP